MAIDDEGNILAVNESALLQLGCSTRRSLVGEPIGKYFQFNFGALEQRARFKPSAIWPVRDVAHGRRFFAIAREPARVADHAQVSLPNALGAAESPVEREHVGENSQMARISLAVANCSPSKFRSCCTARRGPARKRLPRACTAGASGPTSLL